MEDPSRPTDDENTSLAPGTKLGKYQIVRLLGSGGMGAVYEAVHGEIGKRVAIKTLAPAVAAIPGARQRFLREAQLTSRLNHPNIVNLSDMGTEGQTAYLVMELFVGEDLSQRLERTGPLLPTDLVDLMLPTCSALVAAHDAGIIHRDLKPQNIFLSKGHHGVQPKVLDFGISKSTDAEVSSSLTTTGSIIGTPHYLAPEQIKDARTAGPASDQYALGVILYKCLTNVSPFEGENLLAVLQAIAMQQPVPLLERRPELPVGLAAVVERAMRPMPWERYGSVRELGAALLPFASTRARVLWDETFGKVAVAAARPVEVRRESRTMPMPTPTGPIARLAQESSAFGALGADFVTKRKGPSRSRRWIVAAGLIVAAGAVALLARERPTVTPPRPVPAAASTAGLPPAPVAPAAAPPTAAAAAPETPAHVAPRAPDSKAAAEPKEERPSRPPHHKVTHVRPPAPAPAPTPAPVPAARPRSFNPNGSPVID